MKNVFTIPAGMPFVKSLARQLLAESGGVPENLRRYRILLPTRRACHALRAAFLELGGGKPMLLPDMNAIGDPDEQELAIHLLGSGTVFDLPPGISPLRRQLLLAKEITEDENFTQGPEQALRLAQALGDLLDRIIIEECSIDDLRKVVPEDLSNHWQITLDFLKILSKKWPEILAKERAIDQTDRRNRLIRALAGHWKKSPPSERIIAAGSTGTVPATAELLAVVAGLPDGRVILPGLDTLMDEESWGALDESHPQYGLKHLLEYMDIARRDVALWPGYKEKDKFPRQALASEIMRPAATADAWQKLKTPPQAENIKNALSGLRRIECANRAEEAMVVALLLRETLETQKRTAALVTPDIKLAQQVIAICRRWGITLDNSAGQPLTQTRVGTFLRLSADACIRQFAPVAFISLLRHDFCCVNHDYDTLRKIVDKLEILSLRGLPPEKGINGIKKRLQELGRSSLDALLNQVDASTHRFTSLIQSGGLHKFSDLLSAHIEMAEALAGTPQIRGMDRLWAGDDGTKAAAFLADLQSQAHLLPMVTADNYEKIMTRLMGAITVRPAWGTHPSLAVLGQLEARLIDADTMILAGLNEGVWPTEPTHDPWMSRSMRKDFGLPAPERAIGLAAHDFVQALCAPNVVLTRPRQVDGAPAVPSRWLRRLDTVLQAAGIAPQEIEDNRYLDWARALDTPATITPCKRPEPRPEPQHRLSQLSVTRIETWLQDPYSIYARHILRLKKLDLLETEPEARHFGDLLHKILQQFVIAFPAELPPDAEERLIVIAREEAGKFNGDPAFWDYWWPRFYGVADWLVQHENVWRQNVGKILPEVPGKLQIEVDGKPFTLTARADRIDILKDGGAAIIDYKSGGTYTKTKIISGKHPQLPLEAAILSQGGFEGVGNAEASILSYWKLSGGSPPGDDITADSGVADAAARALEGLQGLVDTFNNPGTPYYSLPAADNIPHYSDYFHLARVKEWTVLGEDTEEAA